MRDGGARDDGSPEPTTEKVTGTTRKCANCGQVGHIKTNKKYVCPFCSHEEKEPAAPGEVEAEGQHATLGPVRPKRKRRRRFHDWRPTHDPRPGDRFWDPRQWQPNGFDGRMGLAMPPRGEAAGEDAGDAGEE